MKRKLQLLGLFAVLMLTALSQLSAQVITMKIRGRDYYETKGIALCIVGTGEVTIDGMTRSYVELSEPTVGWSIPDFKQYYLEKLESDGYYYKVVIRGRVTELVVWNEGVFSIDVSQNPYLVKLDCDENKLEKLDVSHNPNLEYLDCAKNNLKQLDVSKNKKLRRLSCYKNDFSPLAINNLISGLNDTNISSENKEFYPLYFFDDKRNLSPNHVTEARAKGWNVCYAKERDKQKEIPIEDLKEGARNIITMTTTKRVGETIRLRVEGVGEIRIAGVRELVQKKGEFKYYTLTSQTIKIQGKVTSLFCGWNKLSSLDASKNTVLTELDCYKNELSSLDVSKNKALKRLACGLNKLSSLDVSGCTALTKLECFENQLSSLDVSGCTALTELECFKNQLTSLDVSGCTALTELECFKNQLSSLDVSGCTALTKLECLENQLSSLDVSGCTALTKLECLENQLSSLDVSGCTALTELDCANNQLSSLDVSDCRALTELDCASNQLIELKGCTSKKLRRVGCEHNRISVTAMWHFINDLNDDGGTLGIWYNDYSDGNQLTKKQIDKAISKGWRVISGYPNTEDEPEPKPEPTAIEGLDGVGAFACYPNPATDFVSLKGLEPQAEVGLYSMAGVCVLRGKADASGSLDLDVRQLAEGLYLVKTASRTMKLEVKR